MVLASCSFSLGNLFMHGTARNINESVARSDRRATDQPDGASPRRGQQYREGAGAVLRISLQHHPSPHLFTWLPQSRQSIVSCSSSTPTLYYSALYYS